jgi:hypothetical protein
LQRNWELAKVSLAKFFQAKGPLVRIWLLRFRIGIRLVWMKLLKGVYKGL